MMPELSFDLTLLDDAVFSASAATAGEHIGLDYVPGAAIRGAMAAALYRRLGASAWTVFHSGAVRFHDALPVAATGEIGLPVPLSLHRPKDVAKTERIAATRNLHLVGLDGRQPEQWRNVHVTGAGCIFGVEMQHVLKNSVSAETGRVEEGGLFGHHRIRRGQKFALTVGFDATVDPEIVKLVEEALLSGPRLGRSRNTEFGRVRLERRPAEPLPSVASASGLHVVWLLSDTLLLDEFGGSTVVPTADAFGLPGGTFRPDRSFIRVVPRSFFNAALGMHESGQTLLSRGSVLVFDEVADGCFATTGFVGPGRERGLGHFVVDHPLVVGNAPLTGIVRVAEARLDGGERQEASNDDASMLAWLARTRSASQDPALRFAREACRGMEAWYASAGYVRGRRQGVGPKPSQWSRVYAEARRVRSVAVLKDRLREICTDTDADLPAWGADFFPSDAEQARTFLRALLDFVAAAEAESRKFSPLSAVQYFAREAAEKARSALADGGEGSHDRA